MVVTELIDKWRPYPKVELHTHLDCSFSYYAVRSIEPGMRHKKYRNDFVAPARCLDLAEFLRCIDPAIALM